MLNATVLFSLLISLILTGPFAFRWLKGCIYNPFYYHHQIGSNHLSHCCHIFRGCVSEMVVLSHSFIYYIYIPITPGPCFNYLCSVYGICKWSDTLWLVIRVLLFANYTISLSSLCRLIWRHWTIKMLVRYMLPSVCLRLRQFSRLSFIKYMGLCVVKFTQFSCDDREYVYSVLISSSNWKYELSTTF